MKLVIHPPVEAARLDKIRAAAGAMSVVNAASAAEAQAAMPDADAFIGKITPALLASSKKLHWVQSLTASLEHYVFPELIAHPCQLTNMRGLFSDVIAEHVFGFMIALARNFPQYIRNQQEGRWAPVGGETERVGFAAGPGVVNAIDRAHRPLAEATLGIVGVGAIGKEVARRGRAFGMRVLAVDPLITAPPEGVEVVWKPAQLGELLRASDFVVIAAPHTPETEKMFRRPQFQQMQRTAYLINIGRGAIVDLADLTAALAAGEIAGAGLDVFEVEPLPPGHPLWRLPNVIVTPHVAGYSPHIAGRHLAVLLENIRRFRRSEPLENVVNKALWF